MGDSYQAIYDAVRSRISGGNIGEAIDNAARQAFDISQYTVRLYQDFSIVAAEQQRPSVLWRPTIMPDGDWWHALYGPNQMEGVSGFGKTPEEAMRDFDKNWHQQKTPAAITAEQKREAAAAHGQFGVGA